MPPSIRSNAVAAAFIGVDLVNLCCNVFSIFCAAATNWERPSGARVNIRKAISDRHFSGIRFANISDYFDCILLGRYFCSKFGENCGVLRPELNLFRSDQSLFDAGFILPTGDRLFFTLFRNVRGLVDQLHFRYVTWTVEIDKLGFNFDDTFGTGEFTE